MLPPRHTKHANYIFFELLLMLKYCKFDKMISIVFWVQSCNTTLNSVTNCSQCTNWSIKNIRTDGQINSDLLMPCEDLAMIFFVLLFFLMLQSFFTHQSHMLAHPSVTCKLYEAVKHEIKIPNARNSIVISSAMVEFWRPRDHDHQHFNKKKKLHYNTNHFRFWKYTFSLAKNTLAVWLDKQNIHIRNNFFRFSGTQ